MKNKWLLVMALVVLPLMMAAQKTNFKAFYDKYNGKEGFTTIEMGGEMIQLLKQSKAKSDKNNPFDGIELIRLVVSENKSQSFVEEIKKIPQSDFKLITSLNSDGQYMTIYFKEDKANKQKSEFLMIAYGEKDNLVVNIVGDLDIKNISGLSQIRISGTNKTGGSSK